AQVEEVIFELMGWSEGYFAFEERGREHWETEATFRIPTAVLLMEAARRIDEWSRIEKRITHLGLIPRLTSNGEGTAPLDLLPAEWEVLAVVDSERSVRDIASQLGRPEFDVAKTVFGLTSAGIIHLEDPARRSSQGTSGGELARLLQEAERHLAVGDPASAIAAAERAIAAHPHQPLAQFVYGRALLASSRYEEAADSLWIAVELDPTSPAAHRVLGLSLAACGRFREAVEVWDQWKNLGLMPPEEEAEMPLIERVRQAALTIDVALRGGA
ncbi:MAG: tetratricopeptide repeat protein, partial [Gemmatimonadota bacterium]